MLSIRKIGTFGRTYRHLNRYRQILSILIKYGFGDLVERLNIEQYIEIGLQMLSNAVRSPYRKRYNRPERVRMALEELGPTYIKLGQLLSIRSDLIHPDFIEEFSKLQDNVTPIAYYDIALVLEREFKAPLSSLYAFIDENPLASASIGQVHRANLINGEEAAIKIQRPGIRSIIEVDLEIMLHLATLMEGNIEEMAFYRPVKIVEEFARAIEKELDYAVEASNMERFSRQFLTDQTVYIPKVYQSLSTDRVLTMEYIDGIKITKVKALDAAGLNKKIITARGADLFLRQVFDHGFFHADPHPGNICILPRQVICLMDFGMMGSVDRYTRANLADLVYGVVKRDEVRTTRILLKITEWEEEPDIRLLERDVEDIMGRTLYRPLKDIEIGKLLQDLIGLTSRYQLRIPANIFLMLKMLSTIEGIASQLNPEFDMASHTAPFIKREKMEKYRPRRIAEDVFDVSSELFHFLRQFPKESMEILRQIKKQRLSVQFEHHGLESMIETHERISNKLSFAIIIAALIIGSSIIVIAKIPPMFYGISLIGIIIFITAAIMGIWLIIAIIRKGKL